jgi:hypothetical protein
MPGAIDAARRSIVKHMESAGKPRVSSRYAAAKAAISRKSALCQELDESRLPA